MPTFHTTRRSFMQSAIAAATATYWISTTKTTAQESQSKNDRPRIGAIGIGGQGMGDTRAAAMYGDVVAVCDADLKHAEAAKAAFGGKADVYQDYRKLLDRNDVDVIINGTPDHWHTKINIDACRAGKDIYTEKPFTLTIDEGRKVCETVKETGRVVQVGTQQRSARQFQTAIELVRNGRIGKLQQVWVALPWYSTKGGPFATQDVPANLDWDLYQGQSPTADYAPQRTHKTFRWFYMYAGGIVTDWGNHHVDIAQWGMDRENTGPVKVDARGLFPNEDNPASFNTADRFFSRMTYADGLECLYFSAINNKRTYGTEPCVETPQDQLDWLFGEDCPDEIRTFERDGIMFIGENGRIFVNRGGLYGKAAEELAENPLPDDAWRVRPSANHMANFFDCVKSRETPVSPVEIQHRTITCCHLTNISLRLDRPLQWNPQTEQIIGDDQANAMQSRKQREGYEIG